MICKPVVVGALLLLVSLAEGCRPRVAYLNDLEPYSGLIGRRFALKQDCCVVVMAGNPFIVCLNPPPHTLRGLPQTIRPETVNTKIDSRTTILGFVPKQTVFRVTAIRNERTFESSRYIYEIALEGALADKWPVLDADWVTHVPRAQPRFPRFKGHCVLPLDPASEGLIWWPDQRSPATESGQPE